MSSSGWRWRGRSATARSCCSPTSPPAISTPDRPQHDRRCCGAQPRAGTTLVLVTHEPELAARARRVMRLAGRRRGRRLQARHDPSFRPADGLARDPRPRRRLRAADRPRSRRSRRAGGDQFLHRQPARVRAAQARALLGADLARCGAAPSASAPRRCSATSVARRGREAGLARVVSFGAMAVPARRRGDAPRAGARGRAGLAVLRHDRDRAPAGEWARLAEGGGVLAEPTLLAMLGAARRGRRSRSARRARDARHRRRACRATSGCAAPSVRGSTSRAADAGETGLLRAARARATRRTCASPSADAGTVAERFRSPLSAERVAVRTVEEERVAQRDAHALRQLPGPGGARGAAARGAGCRQRRPRVHQAASMTTIAVLRCLGASASRSSRCTWSRRSGGPRRQPARCFARRGRPARAAPPAAGRAARGRELVAVLAGGGSRGSVSAVGGGGLLAAPAPGGAAGFAARRAAAGHRAERGRAATRCASQRSRPSPRAWSASP